MVIDTLEQFSLTLPVLEAVMGLDLGQKTIGIAVSDKERIIATGLRTLRRTKFQHDFLLLKEIISDRHIKGIVLGLPLNMNGSEGPRCQSVRAFARNLTARIEIPIVFWDERLSSVEAERTLLEGNLSRRKRAEVIDFVAASYILQGALDRMIVLKSKV
ncbi:MAG: Holliday junction resolvase RuvX [Pseudomonadota bacterium]|nr:Holliday junction resolvase RuvX [Pseudomonadota bacterium]